MSSSDPPDEVPTEFSNIMHDFVEDIKRTFPEKHNVIKKWWKDESDFAHIEDDELREKSFNCARTISIKMLFKFCQKKYSSRFTDLLYQSSTLFDDEADKDTEFLPNIHFNELFHMDISDNTKETIWKYLQLVLFSVIGANNSTSDIFGDTSGMMDSLKNGDFKDKFDETLTQIHEMFGKGFDSTNAGEPDGENVESSDGPGGDKHFDPSTLPSADELNDNMAKILNSKLGKLATRMAEKAARNLGLDTSNMDHAVQEENLKKMMADPGAMMSLMKDAKKTLDEAVASGEINQSELIAEATNMMEQLGSMVGGKDGMPDILKNMGGLAGMASKMGMGGMGGATKQTRTYGEHQHQENETKKASYRSNLKAKLAANRSSKMNTDTNAEEETALFIASEKARMELLEGELNQPQKQNKKKGKKNKI
jgi:hypothetical protein